MALAWYISRAIERDALHLENRTGEAARRYTQFSREKTKGSEYVNDTIRKAAKAAGVRLWQIADGLGIAEGTLIRKLRHEVSEAERQQIMEIVEKLKDRKGE